MRKRAEKIRCASSWFKIGNGGVIPALESVGGTVAEELVDEGEDDEDEINWLLVVIEEYLLEKLLAIDDEPTPPVA